VYQQIVGTFGGRYTISGLEPGQYLVAFGCGLPGRYADQWFPGAPSPGSAELISVGPGLTTGVDAVLPPSGTITGLVRRQGGKPLAGVCAYAMYNRDRTSAFEVIGLPGPMTNARGKYTISGLAAGSYDVAFSQCETVNSRYPDQWYRDQVSHVSATPVRVRHDRQDRQVHGGRRGHGQLFRRVLSLQLRREPGASTCPRKGQGAPRHRGSERPAYPRRLGQRGHHRGRIGHARR
jgi:hypothetical protein